MKGQQFAAILSAIVGASDARTSEMRETGRAAMWTAAGASVNDETPPAWQPEASLRQAPHLDNTERGHQPYA